MAIQENAQQKGSSVFSDELIQGRVENQMRRWQLPMSVLDSERIKDADLDYSLGIYSENSAVRDMVRSEMTAVGAWINPQITSAAKDQLTGTQQTLLTEKMARLDALVDLRTGQVKTEFGLPFIDGSHIGYGLRYDEKHQLYFTCEMSGPGAPALLDESSQHFDPQLLEALVGFHNNVISQVEKAKENS